MRRLARRHGLLCGPSSGAHLIAARRVREQHPEFDTVVTLFCDEREKYLQDHFSKPDGDVVRSAFNYRAITRPSSRHALPGRYANIRLVERRRPDYHAQPPRLPRQAHGADAGPRRVGTECDRTWRARWWPDNKKKKRT